jgi:demethoxyubiquinone hydroxylase (CLK1/Coq7/Cat5 family)
MCVLCHGQAAAESQYQQQLREMAAKLEEEKKAVQKLRDDQLAHAKVRYSQKGKSGGQHRPGREMQESEGRGHCLSVRSPL